MSEESIEMARSRHGEKKSPALMARLLAVLKDGNSRNTSCKLVCLHRSAFYRWLADDPDFKAQVEEAEAVAEAAAVALIRTAAKDDWRAALEWLRRRNKADWSTKNDITINLKDLRNLTDEQLLALEDRVSTGEAATWDDDGDALL